MPHSDVYACSMFGSGVFDAFRGVIVQATRTRGSDGRCRMVPGERQNVSRPRLQSRGFVDVRRQRLSRPVALHASIR